MWSARHRPVTLLLVALAVAMALAHLDAPRVIAAECDGRPLEPVQAADVNTKLAKGEAVFLTCVRVVGRIELRADAGTVGPFFLIQSTVAGGIAAPFVRFGGPVHFDGSCFEGDLDLAGAVFEDEVNWSRASFVCSGKPVRVSAPAARFRGPADLRVEGFGALDLTDASFASRTLFQGTDFLGEATFRGALFEGDTSYRGSVFSAFADFENVTALADLDFGNAAFLDDARFRRLSASGRVSLRDVRFHGDLNLDRASVASADFSRGEVDGPLHMADFSAGSLSMPPPLVEQIEDRDTRMTVLRLIERSAKAAADTGLANNAFFQRRALVTREMAQPRQTLWLGIELVTGYLVRPLRPLIAIGVVALVGLAVRLALDGHALLVSLRRSLGMRVQRTRLVEPRDPEGRRRSSWHIVAIIAAPAGRAFNAAINPKPPHTEVEETDGRTYAIATLVWAEYLVQKLLVVVFLISLGNANPTIREIVTSIV
jgi:uncharacterized protein YjbI with pentapeptide repeats